MCGRYASARSVSDLAEAFGVRADDVDADLAPDWNVAPTKQVPVVVVRTGRPTLGCMRWGLVPSWAADPSIGARLVNARLETVADKHAFRDALVARRCLLPADGWYEWTTRPDGSRQPYYLSPPDGDVLAFAGLWETWYDGEGRPLVTTTIITGPAPDGIRPVHDRAPVVVRRECWHRWLDPQVSDVSDVLVPTAEGIVRAHPVGDAVGDVRANGVELTAPVAVVEQPPLF